MADPNNFSQQNQATAGATDVVIQLQAIARQLSAWVTAFQGRITTGTVTLAAAATTTVSQSAVKATSTIILSPLNAAAATLVGSSKSPYPTTIVPGTSFVIATADSTNAAGTEQFGYLIQTPT